MTLGAVDLVKRLLLSERVVDERGLGSALARAAQTGEDLVSACLGLKLAPERELVRVLTALHAVPGVDLSKCVLRVSFLDLIPEETIRGRLVLPLLGGDKDLLLALAAPRDTVLLEELRFLFDGKLSVVVAVREALRAAIDGAFKVREANELYWRGRGAWSVDPRPEGRLELVPAARTKPLSSPASAPSRPSRPSSPPRPASKDDEAAWLDGFLGGPRDEKKDDKAWLDDFLGAKAPPAPAAAPPKPAAPASIKFPGKSVLVVDDDPKVRALTLRMLHPFGCTALQAEEGTAALSLIRQRRPDLILLDAMLPGMHGFEICRAVRQDAALRGTGVILVSGVYPRVTSGVDLKQAHGADFYFEKPFDTLALARAVLQLLANPARRA